MKLLPADVRLTGPHATQQLLLLVEESGKFVGDLTPDARFTTSNANVVSVDDRGILQAVGDGNATVTAAVGERRATAVVHLDSVGKPYIESFRNHVIPMLTRVGCNAGACHGALAGKGGFKLSLRGYDPETDHFVMTRQALGRRVDRLHPAQSLVLLKPTMALPHGGGRKLEVDSNNYRVLADWIAAGAPAPREDDVRVCRLEVLPDAATLKPGDRLQVLARAWYTDGHVEDVTHWARFSSTEEQVATVDPDGQVQVSGHGEAAITVLYSNFVGTARVTSPYAGRVDAAVFGHAERHNFIDNLVLEKLQSLHIPPSPACTDREFVRRAYLDATGTLPTPKEVNQFLATPGDRRGRLVDELLHRPEFTDYWAYKWSDLLLVSSRKLSQPATWAFYEFIRESVADNKPWDQFAREIVTASGDNLRNGAANYFVLHQDVSELTEATAVTFLGMSITCCRCHNHPLEKWTQDQYWEAANLFSRVTLKREDRGEIDIQSADTGDVLHPRRGIAMPPTPLDGKPLPLNSLVDRRAYFADWLTAADNPYFARALVNRVWRNFMGRGLVEAEDDLRQTNPATNEALLSALAQDFREHHYDVRHLIHTIMTSATYQRSSQTSPANAADDRFYSHYLVRRLPGEVILDAYSAVTGVPTPFGQVHQGASDGVAAYGGAPLGTRALQLPDALVVSPFLESFGRPPRMQTCSCERQQDPTVSQALHLNNGQTLNDKLRAKSGRVETWLHEKISDDEAIRRLFALALSRAPTDAELSRLRKQLASTSAEKSTTRRDVIEDLFWGVLSGPEFLFNH